MADINITASGSTSRKQLPSGNVVFVLREVRYEYSQKYIRVSGNISATDVLKFMKDQWRLDCPMIVLSILTGRSTDKEWQSRQTINSFKTAIKTAAINTDMWVFTHGMNFGVTRMVGEAYIEEIQSRAIGNEGMLDRKCAKSDPSLPLVLIAICPTSMLIDAELFDGSSCVTYTIRGGKMQNGMAELDPHHTHYILVDDFVNDTTTMGQTLSANTLRASIEKVLKSSMPFRRGRFTQIPTSIAATEHIVDDIHCRSSQPAKLSPQLALLTQQHISSTQTITTAQAAAIVPKLSISDERSAATITAMTGVELKMDAAASSAASKPQDAGRDAVSSEPSANQTGHPSQPLKPEECKDLVRDVIPIVCLVIGGGHMTLREIAERVYLGIPVLLCKGSGVASNTLAYVYEELGDNIDPDFENKLIRPEVGRRLTEAFPNADQLTLDECVNAVMQIINGCRLEQRKDHIRRDHIVRQKSTASEDCISSDSQFTGAVLSVFDTRNWKADPGRLHRELLLILLKCRHITRKQQGYLSRQQVYRQLQLLLDWNAPELALIEIFDREDMPVYTTPVHMFEQAIIRQNREAFVDLFLDRNFQIQRFFTRVRVARWLLFNESSFFRDVCINQLLRGTKILESFEVDDDISPLINVVIKRLTGHANLFNPIELRATLASSHVVRVVTAENQVFTALTLLAALLNRHKLARVFLKRCDYPIPVALFCSLLYTKLVHYCREPFMKAQLRNQATEMADYAVGILDLCFQSSDHCSPTEILDQPHLDFSNMTTLQIAYKSKVLQFLAHPLCQRWISQRYYGGLRFLDLSVGVFRISLMIKVLASATLVIPTIWWVSSDSPNESTKPCKSTQSLKQSENTENTKSEHLTKFERFMDTMEDYCTRMSIIGKLWQAPITKFYFNLVSYMLFLLLLGLATLWPSCGNLLIDSIIGIWVCLMTVEISRCTYLNYSTSNMHISVTRSIVDICLHLIFLIAFLWTRLLGNWNGSVNILKAKFVMCLGVLFFTYRVPFVYMAISETLGPQLVWIEYTIKHDFADFVKLLLLAVFAGGITINSMIYPFWPVESNTAFGRIVARSFLAMFLTEKADLEHDEGRTCSPPSPNPQLCLDQSSGIDMFTDIGKFHPNDAAYKALNYTASCPTPSHMGWLFTLQHFILMKLFLMTILYAMFNNSSLSIAKYSSLVWMFKRYENVMAFSTTSTLPPPLNFIYYIWLLMKYICRMVARCVFVAHHCLRCLNYGHKTKSSLLKQLKASINRYKDDNNSKGKDCSMMARAGGKQELKENDICFVTGSEKRCNMKEDKEAEWRSAGFERSGIGTFATDGAVSEGNGPRPTVCTKDGNYWRRLANEYIGKHEDGLLSGRDVTGEDPLAPIRKKLFGESPSTFSPHNQQMEQLRVTITQIKDQVGVVVKSVDRLSEKVQTAQEDITKLYEVIGKNREAVATDFYTLNQRLLHFINKSQLDNFHIHTDSLADIQGTKLIPKWNNVDIVELPCGLKKTIDRRSWSINCKNGLPITYDVNTNTKLPICPFNFHKSSQLLNLPSSGSKLNLFGPNHEVRLLLFRNNTQQQLDGGSVNSCQYLTIQTTAEAEQQQMQFVPYRIVQEPINSNYDHGIALDILRSLLPSAFNRLNVNLIWKGFVSNDTRNCEQAWVEAEYWICQMDELDQVASNENCDKTVLSDIEGDLFLLEEQVEWVTDQSRFLPDDVICLLIDNTKASSCFSKDSIDLMQ